MSFHHPGFLWLLLLGLAILILHLVRKGGRLQWVPFLPLWERALLEEGARPGWRRVQNLLSLLFQLTLLSLIVLSLAHPFIIELVEERRHFSLILENSARMRAAEKNAKTRWNLARKKAFELLEKKGGSEEATLLITSPRPSVVIPSSRDVWKLKRGVESVDPSYGGGDLRGTLSLARQMKPLGEESRVVVVAGSKERDFKGERGEGIHFLNVGEREDNIGFTRFFLTRSGFGAGYEVLMSLKNFGREARRVSLVLSTGEKREITLPPLKEAEVVTEGKEGGFLLFSCRILEEDGLALDNEVWGVLAPIQRVSVALVTQGTLLPCFTSLLNTFSEVFKGKPAIHSPESFSQSVEHYDLVLFDGWAPPELPRGRAFFFFQAPPPWEKDFPAQRTGMEESIVTDWLRSSPFLKSLELSDLFVQGVLQGEIPFGSTPLVFSTSGPLLFHGSERGRFYLFFPFRLTQTNLPLLPAFPLLFRNALEEFFRIWVPKEPVRSWPQSGNSWEKWDKKVPERFQGCFSTSEEHPSLAPGLYQRTLEAGGKEILCHNFLNASESDILPGQERKGEGDVFSRRKVLKPRSLRSLFLLAGICLILLEGGLYGWTRRMR